MKIFFLFNIIQVLLSITCDSQYIYNETQLSIKDKFNVHHAFVPENQKWPYALVNFKIDESLDDYQIDMVLDAIYEIEENSCIRFVPLDDDENEQQSYVKITKGFGCYSSIGRKIKVGEQILNIDTSCESVGSILHEFLHTIGFLHHHVRSDRNKYIEIHYENIRDEREFNFRQTIAYDDKFEYITPFDHNSILIYPEFSHSANGEKTITSHEADKKPSPSIRMTQFDKILLNTFYDCESFRNAAKSFLFEADENGLKNPKVLHRHAVKKLGLIETRTISIALNWLESTFGLN